MQNKLAAILLFVLLVTALGVQGQQFPSERWHEGKLVLISEDSLQGQIKYDLENDLVQINDKGRVVAYAARKILYFEIFDMGAQRVRTFFSLPYQVSENYKTPILFEVLEPGKLTLLCREYIDIETAPQFNAYSRYNNFVTQRRLAFNYYFLVPQTNNIESYSLRRQDLINYFMRKHSAKIKRYMKDQRLRHDQRSHLTQITAFYNDVEAGKF